MDRPPDSRTHASLLARIRRAPDDDDAWVEFVTLYGSRILSWCRAWGLQDADAQDVAQSVLLKLATKLREFEYDPARSFRGWLRTVAHNAWRDYLEQRNRPGLGSGDSEVFAILERVETARALTDCLTDAFDEELAQEAMRRVRLRVERRTWEAFRLLALEGWAGADAARHLGMKVATVFVARSKVQRMLRDEIARLERE